MSEYEYIDFEDRYTTETAMTPLRELIDSCEFVLVDFNSLVHKKDIIDIVEGHRGPQILYSDGMFDWWYSVKGGWKKEEQ